MSCHYCFIFADFHFFLSKETTANTKEYEHMGNKKYTVSEKLDMPAIEKEIAQYWKDHNIFEKSVNNRPEDNKYVFYEGPPSANGLPGIHHVISRTLKDMICRYQTMKGNRVVRKAGWDTHGLPVELSVEKKLGITKKDIGKKISVEEYNAQCRQEVMKYKDLWDKMTQMMGYWVDLDDPYVTFENDYIETLWWALKQLYSKDFLYKSVSIQPYSPAAGTGLSSHELNQPGTYRVVKDTSATVLFELDEKQNSDNPIYQKISKATADSPAYLMAWTTTPWTLPSNTGLTVGSKIKYDLIKTFNPYTDDLQYVFIAEDLVPKYFSAEAKDGDFESYDQSRKNIPWAVVDSYEGKELEGLYYKQLLPYVLPEDGNPFRVILGNFVTTEDGTGIVHTAPAFGADDFIAGKQNDLGMLMLVDQEGKFLDSVGEFGGRYVKNYKDDPDYQDVNVDISVKLKKEGKAFKVEKYEHSYPHCWRTDKPIIYYPLDAWFVRTTAVKDRMIELNKTINWKPKHTGEKRFGNWLENLVDWNLSRSRYWGTPLPIWTNEEQTEFLCIGSIDELTEAYLHAKEQGLNQNQQYKIKDGKIDIDLHKPYVDEIELISEKGSILRRVPDLIDVWFDSGAMPYAQWHYPFENQDNFRNTFPADFIAEGVDQTRGWFYTLHVLGTMLMDSVAYKNVISNGLVLDKNGDKMSKRKGNVVDPFDTIEKYSADATRWYLITNAAPWESNKFDIDGLQDVKRKFFGTFYNTYQFFAMYANLDGFDFSEEWIPMDQRPEIDRWIISEMQSLIGRYHQNLEDYEPTKAFSLLQTFLDDFLSNWYVRLNRRRFWKGDYEQDKISAYQTLYFMLEQLCLLMAPLSPFISDKYFQNLNNISGRFDLESVHLADTPLSQQAWIDVELEQRMQLAMDITSLVLSIRKKEKIKVRQPLQKVLIPVLDKHMETQIEKVKDIIISEVNVKEIEYIYDTTGVIDKQAKPVFKILGARLGKDMKEVAALIQNFAAEDITRLESEGSIQVTLSNGDIANIDLNEVEIVAKDIPGWAVATNGQVTVALDVHISPELEEEGLAREIVNKVQNLRKENGLEITDRINLDVDGPEKIKKVLLDYKSYICAEILADNINSASKLSGQPITEINEYPVRFQLKKI